VLWPLMTVSLISGFGVLLFGTVFPPLGWLCGWLCDGSFWLLEWSVSLGHRMPCGHFWMPGPADWWLWGFYSALGLFLAFPRIRPRPRWCAAIVGTWIVAGLAVSYWPSEHKCLDCTFLSMEHGCGVFVEFPNGKTMLYDAGRMSAPSIGARAIANFLWDRGRRRIDAVVLSHPDIDHYNALPELLEKFLVGRIYVTPAMLTKDNRTIGVLRDAIDRCGVPVQEVRAGDSLPLADDCPVEVLHPSRHGPVVAGNTDSLVLAVEYRGRRILLPGDLESPGLDDMLKEKPRPCEVLMAPHHGSRKSNSAGLAAWCKPRLVVFSGDGRWNLPEIDSTYRAVGGRSLQTHDCGAIHVQIDGDSVRVSPFVKPD
jgi:competence protein ComEC